MLFNSLHFLLFFPIVTLGFFLLPHKQRWWWLLLASCYFYMAFIPVYILILGITIVVDYIAGIMIENASGQRRKNYLIISLITNISFLFVFKYYNFFTENVNQLASDFGLGSPIPLLDIILPIGLSFHTFQAMSYTIEVYRGNQKAERHFGIYALYVMFYPQLVAGPIERPQNILHQFHEEKRWSYDNFIAGIKIIFWGLFKKMVVADRLAVLADYVFNNPMKDHSSFTVLLAMFFFSIQIYCDFSGYSDIAIGTARVMGYDLMTNFRRPYFATNISEFWSRWHISLSTWFRDYLYIPLGGNRVVKWKAYRNIAIVFLVSGFWHGANWTFLIWGGIHALFSTGYSILKSETSLIKKLPERLNFFYGLGTFIICAFAWVFFRAKNFTDAISLIKQAVDIHPAQDFRGLISFMQMRDSFSAYYFASSFMVIVILFVGDYILEKGIRFPFLGTAMGEKVWKPAFYLLAILFFLLFACFNTQTQFIYFQF